MKKFLSLILSVMMLSGLISIPANAAGAGAYVNDSDMTGVSSTQGTASWIVTIDPNSADSAALAATDMTSLSGSNQTIWAGTSVAVYSLPLPTVPAGKIITSAEFRVSSRWETEPTAIAYSYKMPGEHDMTKITIGDMQKFVPGNNLGSGEYYLAPVKTGDEYWYSTYIYRNRYDVTDYISECIEAGQTNVYIAVAHGSAVKAYRYDKEYKAKLYYTLGDIPDFEVTQTTPANNAQNAPMSGNAVFTFSNNVKSATAKVAGSDGAEVFVEGKTVKVPYTSEGNSLCEISVTASDKYGHETTATLKFTTERDIIDAEVLVADSAASWCNGGSSRSFSGDFTTDFLSIGSDGAAFYKLPVPEVEVGKYLSSYKLKLLVKLPEDTINALDEADNIRAYAVGDEYKFEDGLYIAGEENDDLSNVTSVINDYASYKAGDIKAIETNEENTLLIEVELTSLARMSKDELVVALTLNSANGAKFASEANVLYEIENNPRIKFHSPKISLWGCELTGAGFGVYTDGESIAKSVTITNASGVEAEGVKFEYNPHSNKIELSKSIVLDESANYSVVIKEGAEDSFGNKLTDKIEVASFETGKFIAVTPEQKDALWNAFTSSDDGEELSEKWELFADVFKFDVPSFKEISYPEIFFKRLAANTDKEIYSSYSENNAQKLCELFEALALEVSTEQALLGEVSGVTHMSEVEKLITNEEKAKLLGIEVYLVDYESLYSKDSVNVALMGKAYKEVSDFVAVFVPALEEALENNEAPSGGSVVGDGASKPSGKGSSSFGNPGYNPPLAQTPSEEVKPASKFNDISGYDWANDAIELLADRSIVNGRAEGVFAPGENVTRAEFVTMIVNAFGWYDTGSESAFTDVSANDWFTAHVASGANKGIITGDGGLFNPNVSITREDMAVIAFRALLASGKTLDAEKSFTDSGVMADYAIEAIGKMAGSGVLSGMPDGSFEPKRNLTRAEAAVVIYNMLTKLS